MRHHQRPDSLVSTSVFSLRYSHPRHTKEKRIMDRSALPQQHPNSSLLFIFPIFYDPRAPGWGISIQRSTKSPAGRKKPPLHSPAVSWGATSACLAGATLAPLTIGASGAVERLEGLGELLGIKKETRKSVILFALRSRGSRALFLLSL